MANALEATQGQPDGEAANDPGNSNTAPEQNNYAEHADNDIEDNQNAENEVEGQDGDGTGEATAEAEEQQQEQEKPKPGEKKKLPWELRRINEETNKRREAERKLAETTAELERLRKGGQSDENANGNTPDQDDDIEARVARHAEQIVQNREFASRVNNWADAGVKEFGADEFNNQCNLIASLVDDKTQRELMDTLTDPDQVKDGHKVIMELAADPEEAERILSLPPKKMALALAKISDRVTTPAAPAPKPISKAPAPITPIGGGPKTTTRLEDENIPMDEWAKQFNKTMLERQKR